MKWLLLLLAGTLIFTACSDDDDDPVEPTPCNQCVISMPAAQDNTLYQPDPDRSNGIGQEMFIGLDTGNIRRAVVAFNVHAYIPPGSTVDSVRVFVTTITGTPVTFRVWLHRLNKDWGEGASRPSSEPAGAQAAPGDATWTHTFWPDSTWVSAGGDFATVPSGSTDVAGAIVRYAFNTTPSLVADVQAWLDDPSTNFGWVIRGNETLPGSLKSFGTQQNAVTERRPSLQVFYRTP
jgi:hypothetical protein